MYLWLGLFVNCYSGSCDSGGTFTYTTTEINQVNYIIDDLGTDTFLGSAIQVNLAGGFVEPPSHLFADATNSLWSLGTHITRNLLNSKAQKYGIKASDEFLWANLKKYFYYGDFIINAEHNFDGTNYFRTNDFAFATEDIISYSNQYTSKAFNNDYYNMVQNTIVRKSSKYQIGEDSYLITYVNGEDVSSLLPSGTSSTYLNSPIYSNSNTPSGGFCVAYVGDIINGPKEINYYLDYSPIYNTYDQQMLDNIEDENNEPISNDNTQYAIDTEDTNSLIKKFITYLKSIDDKLSDLKTNVTNNVNNTTLSLQNFYLIDKLALKDSQEDFIDTFNESMGIIADIPTMALYALGRFANLNNGDITFVVPKIEIFDTTLLNQTTINFTNLINSETTFVYLHNIALVCSDVLLLAVLVQLAKRAFEEVKR